ncbi:MAG: asparaginase, partial [Aquiluna sp.]
LKPLQALAMKQLGLHLPPAETAITMASHYGTDRQVELGRSVLARFDIEESKLGCPADLPWNPQARAGKEKLSVHMNCSGKHAGFLATAKLNHWELDSYLQPSHPLQLATKQLIEEYAVEQIAQTTIDGCGAPLFALSTLGLARAISKFVLDVPDLVAAAQAEPWLIGDVTTPDSFFLKAGLFSKLGAEGVFTVATTDGHAVAMKIADGSLRAAPAIALSMLERQGLIETSAAEQVAKETVVYAMGGSQQLGQLVSKI